MAQKTATEKLAQLRKQQAEITGGNKAAQTFDEDRLRNIEMKQEGDKLHITVDLSDPWGNEFTPKKGAKKGQKCFVIKHADCTSFGRPLDLGDKWLKLTLTDKQ